ncbi:unnamed protein product [Aureobasidium pullulans]|nr:unnamed protein product [Aureobasidium pullulans]
MNLNPHEYTSGRWLHRNKEQTEARYIQFDYDALCRKAVEQCPGSQSVAECKKIEGGSNRVFLFTMDDEQTLIARLPFSLAGPSRLVIHSEVAAIAYRPHCGSTYWNCAPGEASIYRQMRPDLFSYCKSLVASARSRIPASAPEDQLPYRGSIQEHVKFVTDCEAVLYDLIKEPQVQRVARPTLLHADLHKRNIFVSDSEPSKITGIIDWQSTSIEPAFVYANETPDFATLVDDMPRTARDGQD